MRALPTRVSLAEDITDRIREEILDGGLRSGQRLIETRLAQELGVSRGPLREALKTLSAEGLVNVSPRRGTFVATLSSRDVNEIYEVRAAVEEHAVERLATSGSKRDFEELTRVHERMAESVSLRDNSRVARYDLEWHEAICRLGGNRRLLELYKKDYVSLRALILLDDRLYSPLEKTLAEHSAVLDAVYRRDAELARSLLAHHIDDSRRTVISELNKRPGKTRDS